MLGRSRQSRQQSATLHESSVFAQLFVVAHGCVYSSGNVIDELRDNDVLQHFVYIGAPLLAKIWSIWLHDD